MTPFSPQVADIPDWYFQTTGIRPQPTKPETMAADAAYMKSYNEALTQALKAQGKFPWPASKRTSTNRNNDNAA